MNHDDVKQVTSISLWLANLKYNRVKFFVLKAEDFLRALDDEEVDQFDQMLYAHECLRVRGGRLPSNRYYVVNRDEPYADEIRAIIEKHEGPIYPKETI